MSLRHAWCAEVPVPAAQVWRHESVKTWQVLVSLTACMVTSILARPDELNMKSPVAVNGCRAWFFLGERYRLPVLLRLHAISMVRQLPVPPAVFDCRSTALVEVNFRISGERLRLPRLVLPGRALPPACAAAPARHLHGRATVCALSCAQQDVFDMFALLLGRVLLCVSCRFCRASLFWLPSWFSPVA